MMKKYVRALFLCIFIMSVCIAPCYAWDTVLSDDFSGTLDDKWTVSGGNTNYGTPEIEDGILNMSGFNRTLTPKGLAASGNLQVSFDIKCVYKDWTDGLVIVPFFNEAGVEIFAVNVGVDKCRVLVAGKFKEFLGWMNYGGHVTVSLVRGKLSFVYVDNTGAVTNFTPADDLQPVLANPDAKYTVALRTSPTLNEGLKTTIDNVDIKSEKYGVALRKVVFSDDFSGTLDKWTVSGVHPDYAQYGTPEIEDGILNLYGFNRTLTPKELAASDNLQVSFNIKHMYTDSTDGYVIVPFFNEAGVEVFAVNVGVDKCRVSVAGKFKELLGWMNYGGHVTVSLVRGKLSFVYVNNTGAVTNFTPADDLQPVLANPDAKYTVALKTSPTMNEGLKTTIDNVVIDTMPDFTALKSQDNTFTVSAADLKIQTGYTTFDTTAVLIPGENYKLTFTTAGEYNGKVIAALYDDNMLVGAQAFDSLADIPVYIPVNLEKPIIKVLFWDSLTNLSPMVNGFIKYTY